MNRRQLFARLSGMTAASTALQGGELLKASLPSMEVSDVSAPKLMGAVEKGQSPLRPAALQIDPIASGELEDCPEWIRRWRQQPRYPVLKSPQPLAARLLDAIHSGSPLEVVYFGGARPGRSRRFTPASLFRAGREDSAVLYVSGWCHERQAHRTLRLDKLTIPDPLEPAALQSVLTEVAPSRAPAPHSDFRLLDTISHCTKSGKLIN